MEDEYTFEYHDEDIEKLEQRLGITVEPTGLKIEGIDHTVTCTNPSTTNNTESKEDNTMADTLREKMEKAAKAEKSNNPVRIFKHYDEVSHHQHKKAWGITAGVVGGAAAVTTAAILIHKHHEDSYGGCNGTSGEFNSAF